MQRPATSGRCAQPGNEMIELIVGDLMCDADKATIETAVGTIDPCVLAEVDVAGKWVRIASREPATEFVSAIGATGFEARIWWDGSPAPVNLPSLRRRGEHE